jgi:hypothetical protein
MGFSLQCKGKLTTGNVATNNIFGMVWLKYLTYLNGVGGKGGISSFCAASEPASIKLFTFLMTTFGLISSKLFPGEGRKSFSNSS